MKNSSSRAIIRTMAAVAKSATAQHRQLTVSIVRFPERSRSRIGLLRCARAQVDAHGRSSAKLANLLEPDTLIEALRWIVSLDA